MKLFLDANVFSAANLESRLNDLFWILTESQDLVSSDYAREEAARNVAAKRPDWSGELERALGAVRIVRSVDRPLPVDLLDEEDRPILATAIRERCDRLVTGDKRHFGRLFGTTVEEVRVVTPLDLARELYG